MKKLKLVHYLLIATTMGVVYTGCKKDDRISPSSTPTVNSVAPTASEIASYSQSTTDLTNVEENSDESMDDVNSVVNSSSLRASNLPCNATIDTSSKSTGLITVNFNGLNCSLTKKRTGSISIQLPMKNGQVARWSDTGVTMCIVYNNFKITRVADSSSVTFNGGLCLTNVTGGNVFTIGQGDSIVHQAKGEMQITFSDSTTRSWGVARTRTFYKKSGWLNILGGINVKVTGDTTINGDANAAVWGTNRAGESFSVSFPSPLIVDNSISLCGFRQISGVKVYRRGSNALTITYGVDASGNVVASGTCSYGYKLSWTDSNGNAKEVVRPLFF